MIVEVHQKFRHDCSDFPEGFERPQTFAPGELYEVPDAVGEYFIAAGWASLPGEEPVEPPSNKPVTLDIQKLTVDAKVKDA